MKHGFFTTDVSKRVLGSRWVWPLNFEHEKPARLILDRTSRLKKRLPTTVHVVDSLVNLCKHCSLTDWSRDVTSHQQPLTCVCPWASTWSLCARTWRWEGPDSLQTFYCHQTVGTNRETHNQQTNRTRRCRCRCVLSLTINKTAFSNCSEILSAIFSAHGVGLSDPERSKETKLEKVRTFWNCADEVMYPRREQNNLKKIIPSLK